MAAALLLAAAIVVPDAVAGEVSDADALAITRAHCVMCHARKPMHPSFDAPPKGVVLETIDELRAWRRKMLEQVVLDRNMPIGDDMTEEERAALARWIERQ
jgi:uncharacterized membrane protein